jgi:hypothetical protein
MVNQPGSRIGGVRDPPHVSRPTELLDDGTDSLLTELCGFRQLGESGSASGDPLEDARPLERYAMTPCRSCPRSPRGRWSRPPHERGVNPHGINTLIAVRHGSWPPGEIVASVRDHTGTPRTARILDTRDALFDIVVHSQDIAIPLGREVTIRSTAAAGA